MTMLSFTAFVAQLSELTEFKTGGSYWAIQLSAGVSWISLVFIICILVGFINEMFMYELVKSNH